MKVAKRIAVAENVWIKNRPGHHANHSVRPKSSQHTTISCEEEHDCLSYFHSGDGLEMTCSGSAVLCFVGGKCRWN